MRSEPFVTVTCDSCKSSEEVGLTTLARGGYDERNMDSELESLGWRIENGQDICPGCADEADMLADEAAEL